MVRGGIVTREANPWLQPVQTDRTEIQPTPSNFPRGLPEEDLAVNSGKFENIFSLRQVL